MDTELDLDAENKLDSVLELDEAADLTKEIDPENSFFEYIDGVTKDAIKLEKFANNAASRAQHNLTQARSRNQYLESKKKLEDAQRTLYLAEQTLQDSYAE